MSDPDARCIRCGRLARQHGNQRKHWRVCGPVTGTASGPMTDAERARYVAGAPR